MKKPSSSLMQYCAIAICRVFRKHRLIIMNQNLFGTIILMGRGYQILFSVWLGLVQTHWRCAFCIVFPAGRPIFCMQAEEISLSF